MIKNEINLMPWRLAEHQKQFKYFLWQLVIFILLVISIWGIYAYSSQQLQQHIANQTEQLEQEKIRLNQLTKQIEQQRQIQIETKHYYHLPWQQTQALLDLLPQLPFIEGELQTLDWQANTEQQYLLSFQGIATSQTEFEQIQQFLRQQPFTQAIQLKELLPVETNLQFQFELHKQE